MTTQDLFHAAPIIFGFLSVYCLGRSHGYDRGLLRAEQIVKEQALKDGVVLED